MLLSRSYTDARHLAGYTREERAAWAGHIARVRAAYGETMPAAWLRRFPTLRNLRRPPGERRTATHLFARREGGLASHVALFQQRFEHQSGHFAGWFIEDVATDPDLLGLGLASQLMGLAVQAAREAAMPVLGLATGIPEFYERLGWAKWNGPATFAGGNGAARPDPGLMIFQTEFVDMPLFPNSGEAIRTFRI